MSHKRFLRRALAPLAGLLLVTGCPDPDPVPADGSTSTSTGPNVTSDDSPTTANVDSTADSTLDSTATTGSGTETETDDTDTTGDPPDLPPGRTIVCDNRFTPAPDGEICEVTAGDSTFLLQGTVLAGFDVYENGTVLVDASEPNGRITCAGCDCADLPQAATATVISCAEGVISPGLINPHDHITFTLSQPVPHGMERYDHRHEWRLGLGGATELNTFPGSDNSRQGVLYGELRMLLGGATSLSGSVGGANAEGLLRNLDRANLTEGLTGVDVNYRTFPLGDSDGTQLTSGCNYPFIDGAFNLGDDIYMPHIAEGIDDEARNEFLCLSGAPGGEDLIASNTSVVHGIGVVPIDVDTMGDEGAVLVWSPRSNVDLYGITAEITTYRNLGVRIALGTDWTASGSMNMLRELACADSFNQGHLGGAFSDLELWLMATYWAAVSQGADDQIGLIRPGHIADLTIFDGSQNAAHRAVINADVSDVALVMRGGQPLHGDTSLIEALVDPADASNCEMLDVCGVSKRLCAQPDTGLSIDQITGAIHPASYPLFFCGDPDEEPSCDPARPGEFPNRGGPDDADGDGVPNDEDNCPSTFNPIRPLDAGQQADADSDGLGDACDRCPLAPGEGCPMPDVFDQDGDGVEDPADNCVEDDNPDQADGDDDGVGDACDPCPMVANPAGGACPVSIYDIKDGTIAPGTYVSVNDVVVTGAGPEANGYFVQVHPDDADYQGAEFSGVFVYTNGNFTPAIGDRVTISGTVNVFFEQIQLDASDEPDPPVLSSGNPLPAPEPTTPADIVEMGMLQEELEGVLVTVFAVGVTNDAPAGGPGDAMATCEFEVTDGLRVNDFFYCVDPFPMIGQTYTQIIGISRWANGFTKLEPRSIVDYPPSLIGFGEPQSYLLEGTMAVPIPELRVQLTSAVTADTPINLTYADMGVVTGPPTVTVPVGSDSVPVVLTGVAVGTADVTAELDGVAIAASVRVYDDAEPRSPTLSPSMLAVPVMATADLTVTLDLPAPAAGQVVDLVINPGTCAAVPDTVDVLANELSAVFTVNAGACAGDEVVTASIGPAVSNSTVSVVDSPAFPNLVIAEVYYDHPGGDDMFEWVKIYNGTGAPVDLSGHSLGWGGTDYTYGVLDLNGIVGNGDCFVVGGPSGDADNGFPGGPMYDQAVQLMPGMQNSGGAGDGVAVFDVAAGAVGPGTVPLDAVIYGPDNSNGLLDETGMAGMVDVADAPSGNSVRLQSDGTWAIEPNPAPLECTPFPIP